MNKVVVFGLTRMPFSSHVSVQDSHEIASKIAY